MELGELRELIDYLSKNVINSVHERSKLKRNDYLYSPISIDKKSSFLEYALHKKEAYYASIGRYMHNLEFSITSEEPSEDSIFKGLSLKDKKIAVDIDVPDLLIKYEEKVIKPFCKEGEDNGRAGQIVDIDTNVLQNLHRRIQIGRYVADKKIKKNGELKELLENYSQENDKKIIDMLIVKKREDDVILDAQKYSREKFSSSFKEEDLDLSIKNLFRYIIDTTLDLEIKYLKKNFAIERYKNK